MKSECCEEVEGRWGYADMGVVWLWRLCKWVRGVEVVGTSRLLWCGFMLELWWQMYNMFCFFGPVRQSYWLWHWLHWTNNQSYSRWDMTTAVRRWYLVRVMVTLPWSCRYCRSVAWQCISVGILAGLNTQLWYTPQECTVLHIVTFGSSNMVIEFLLSHKNVHSSYVVWHLWSTILNVYYC